MCLGKTNPTGAQRWLRVRWGCFAPGGGGSRPVGLFRGRWGRAGLLLLHRGGYCFLGGGGGVMGLFDDYLPVAHLQLYLVAVYAQLV